MAGGLRGLQRRRPGYAIGVKNASDFDLEIMNRSGDRFLDLPGVHRMSGPYEFYCEPASDQTMERAEPSGPYMVM